MDGIRTSDPRIVQSFRSQTNVLKTGTNTNNAFNVTVNTH